MTAMEKAAQSFAEVGPIGDFLAVNEYTAEGLWHIAVSEDAIVFAEVDAARGVVALSADLGAPAPDKIDRLARTALLFNHGWTQSGGARLSVESESGAFWLIADIAADTDARALAERIRRFADAAAAWRDIVAGRASAPAGDDVASLSFAAIRI